MSALTCGCDAAVTWTCERHRQHADPSPLPSIADSGRRQQFASGMVRDVMDGKVDYTLVLDGPMFERWAAHLTAGARKYEARNWMKAATEEEYQRFRASALRHFVQWLRGDGDEDHAAAVYFNVCGAEYTRGRLDPDGTER